MKLIIAGARTFTDSQLLCQTLAPERHRLTEVIHGGARGADQLGFRWALKHHIRSRCFAADWERFGKSAGVRRNHQMAQAGDVLVAFHGNNNPGTAHMIACMRALGKPVVVIQVEATA
jgi:YspA, cpYpsA-related SLOG family